MSLFRTAAARFYLSLIAAPLVLAAAPAEDVAAVMDRGQSESAFDRARSASQAGQVEGDEALAWFYETGTFVPRDEARAVSLYRRAAEAGRAESQWRLGVMLDEGRGVSADEPGKALAWFASAALQGHAKAHASLGVMYATGRGTDLDYGKAMESYLSAARLGEPHGFYGVGLLFALGQGVERDDAEAAAWLFAAYQMGDVQAEAPLMQLIDELDDAAIDAIADRAVAIADALDARIVEDVRAGPRGT